MMGQRREEISLNNDILREGRVTGRENANARL